MGSLGAKSTHWRLSRSSTNVYKSFTFVGSSLTKKVQLEHELNTLERGNPHEMTACLYQSQSDFLLPFMPQ